MQNFTTSNKNKKYVNFNESGILLSGTFISNNHNFEKKKEKQGFFHLHGLYQPRILEYTVNEKTGRLILKYLNNKDKIKTEKIIFDKSAEGLKTSIQIADLYAFTQGETLQENKFMANGNYLFYLALCIIFTWVLYISAIEYETSGNVEIAATGQRKSSAMILVWLAKTLGSWGSIIVGSLVALFLIYKIVTRLKHPAYELFYYKEDVRS